VLYGVSMPREQKMSQPSNFLREYTALVGDSYFVVDSPSPFILLGQSTAYAWYLAGCRTLQDVKQRKGGIHLSQAQVIGLKYYDGALSHATRYITLIVVKQISIRGCHEKRLVRYSGKSSPSVSSSFSSG
jgi:Fingers domain of DNA polymerase lambda